MPDVQFVEVGVCQVRFLPISLLLLLSAATVAHAGGRSPKSHPAHSKVESLGRITSLRVLTPQLTIKGPYASSTLLVDGVSSTSVVDLSGKVIKNSADPAIVSVDPDGSIRPH